MARFIALPVGKGDSFYLERQDGFSVLVDGGGSRSALPSLFQIYTKTDDVDIVICTHNDSDHANGIIGFLGAGLKCEEVWLPGRWLAALPAILRPLKEVIIVLAGEVAEADSIPNLEERKSGLSAIEAYAERQFKSLEKVTENNDVGPVGIDGWPTSCLQMLEEAESWENDFQLQLWPLWWSYFLGLEPRNLRPGQIQLTLSALAAANRIREIAVEAFHRGLPIRWFDFDTETPSGGKAEIQPLNAREITSMPSRAGRLLDILALTVDNRESLVFWSPPTDNHPGVLFTADSDLKGVKLKTPLQFAIATAPHHGSEENANAYYEVDKALKPDSLSITWVRSDGRYKIRPGSTYLGLKSRKMCTICRRNSGSFVPKKAVHLFIRTSKWTRHRVTAECSCQ